MHVEDERHARGLAATAIGETDALGFDELRGCVLMGMSRHRPSAIEKKSGVRQKEVRVLKVRCVAGVRVDDQLCIGDVLRKREGIVGRAHDVPVSVYAQRRLGDLLQLAKASSSDFPPFSSRRKLFL